MTAKFGLDTYFLYWIGIQRDCSAGGRKENSQHIQLGKDFKNQAIVNFNVINLKIWELVISYDHKPLVWIFLQYYAFPQTLFEACYLEQFYVVII